MFQEESECVCLFDSSYRVERSFVELCFHKWSGEGFVIIIEKLKDNIHRKSRLVFGVA